MSTHSRHSHTVMASKTRGEIEASPNQTTIDVDPGHTLPHPKVFDKSPSANDRTCKVICQDLILAVLTLFLGLTVGIIPAVLSIVLLLAAFVGVTLIMLVRHGHQYDKVTQIKFVIRFWIFVVVMWLTCILALLILIARHAQRVKNFTFLGLSSSEWLGVILPNLFVLGTVDFVFSFFVHLLPPIRLGYNESGLDVQEAVSELADCLISYRSVYTVINLLPHLKKHTILGLYTWKWARAILFLIIGYNVIRLVTHLTARFKLYLIAEKFEPQNMKHPQHSSLVKKLLPREYLVYYSNGLKRSISFILSSLLTLLTWVFYFVPRLTNADKAERFITRTCVSVLICSVLWLLKTWLVLSWEASATYTRLRSQILDSRKQLYFLGILGRHTHDIFNLTYYGPLKNRTSTNHCLSPLLEFQQSILDELASYRIKSGNFRIWNPILAYFSVFLETTSPNFANRSTTKDRDEETFGEQNDETKQNRVKKQSAKRRETVKYELLMHKRTPTTHDIKQVSQYLITAKQALSDPTLIESILSKLRSTPESTDFCDEKLKNLIVYKSNPEVESSDPNGSTERNASVRQVSSQVSSVLSPTNESVIESSTSTPGSSSTPASVGTQRAAHSDNTDNDWMYFKDEVLKGDDITTWLEKTQNNCLFLANALSSTKEVVDVLNTIFNIILVGGIFLLWLLITDLTTNAVLAVIATPILGASFIFGGSLATLFQGIMYVYVVHPIYVGDICSVEGKQMVVKGVGVWTTTFCTVEKLGSIEEITHPNSLLATKVVVNHLTDVIWDDSVVFNVVSSVLDSSHLKELKKKIDTYFENEGEVFVPCTNTVVIEDVEEVTTITIQLKYKISNVQDWSYNRSVRRKKTIQTNVNTIIQEFQQRHPEPTN